MQTGLITWSHLTVTLVCCVPSIGAFVPYLSNKNPGERFQKYLIYEAGMSATRNHWNKRCSPYKMFLSLLDGGQFHCPSSRPSISGSAEYTYIHDWPFPCLFLPYLPSPWAILMQNYIERNGFCSHENEQPFFHLATLMSKQRSTSLQMAVGLDTRSHLILWKIY